MPWTEQENAVLCEFYPTIGQRVSSMLPGRSRAACSIHASHLGISRENDWAEAEDDLLRKYYPTLGPDASTKISGKSKSACKMRARTLGIRKGKSRWTKQSIYCRAAKLGLQSKYKKPWTEEELSILRELYPSLGQDVAKYLPNRGKQSCTTKACQMGIKRTNQTPFSPPASNRKTQGESKPCTKKGA